MSSKNLVLDFLSCVNRNTIIVVFFGFLKWAKAYNLMKSTFPDNFLTDQLLNCDWAPTALDFALQAIVELYLYKHLCLSV